MQLTIVESKQCRLRDISKLTDCSADLSDEEF